MARISKNPDERKAEIMDTAQALFAQNGFEQTSVADIVKKIGIAQGTFYYHFESKKHLLNEILNRLVDWGIYRIEEIFDDQQMSAADKIVGIFRTFFTLGNDHENLGEYVHQEKNNALHQRLMDKSLERIGSIVVAIVQEGVSRGEFNTIYPQEATEIMIYGISQFIHHQIYVENKSMINRKIQAVEDVIERVLGARKWSIRLQPLEGNTHGESF
jgi:AcrR family transcriptional regulator